MTADLWGDNDDDLTYARGRLPERTYVSRGFTIDRESSRDCGQPARFVYKVFDGDGETVATFDGAEWIVSESEKGRSQLKLLAARDAGNVKELWIQRVPAGGFQGKVTTVLNLKQPEVTRLIELVRNLDLIPITGDAAVRVDDALLREIFANPGSLTSVYSKSPEQFRRLISEDESARDVIAISHRKGQIGTFKRLLVDNEYFDSEVAKVAGRKPEKVWQNFFERNPWMLGVSLSGQLLTSWNTAKLEQAVAGSSIAGVGKRADALMRTSGRIKSMVFAEIKTHRTSLLGPKEYRSGCWPPSDDLSGGVVQAHGTVQRAIDEIRDRLPDVAEDGSEVPGEFTYLIQPRSFLVIGDLNELTGKEGGHHRDRIRSFELYRRQLIRPEVLTFDELLARVEWYVESAEIEYEAEREVDETV